MTFEIKLNEGFTVMPPTDMPLLVWMRGKKSPIVAVHRGGFSFFSNPGFYQIHQNRVTHWAVIPDLQITR